MNVLLWIVRILIILLLIRYLVRFFTAARRVPSRRTAGRGGMERAGGELVRDPQCGTYVPKARAVVSGSGASAKYFCSTTCRDAHARQ